MAEVKKTVRVMKGITPDTIPYDALFNANEPVILKGLVNNWALVKAGEVSPLRAMALLEDNATTKPLLVYQAPAETKARFGYDDNCTGFNFTSARTTISAVFEQIRKEWEADEHNFLYVNSLKFADGFPALCETHDLPFSHPEFENNQPVAKIWLGTESVAAAHFDQPKNIACCVLGKRRFTLFPPDQIDNLYPGPLSPTPGGQVVTLADLRSPDYQRFPKLKTAMGHAYVADLEPGDALYYPSMWWHEVEAFGRFNIMINFWWMTAPPFLGNPMDVLMHGMMSLRDRPQAEKEAWQALFNYYIFGDAEQVREHLPVPSHGPLATMDDNTARRLRAVLLKNLNR